MKKNLFITLFLITFYLFTYSQNVGIGTQTPHSSAQLEVSNNSKGVLIPRMTTSGIINIAGPARGLLVYDSLTNQLMVNKGNAISPDWQPVSNSSGNSGNAWSLNGNNDVNPAMNFIGTTNNVPLLLRVSNGHAGKIDSNSMITFLGYNAGNTTSIQRNTAIGFRSLQNVTSGARNTAVGSFSLTANTTGSFNSAFGDYSMHINISGSYNSAFGLQSLANNSSGNNNTAIGYRALWANETGDGNTAVGYSALDKNTIGSSNVAMGFGSLYNNTTGAANVAVGNSTLASNTIGNNNIAIGQSALNSNTTGVSNTAVGYQAMTSNTEGTFNVAIGVLSLAHNTSGLNNSAFGAFALSRNTSGVQNTVVGNTAMYNNTVGNDNVAMGIEALFTNTTGSKNSAAGWRAMYQNTTGYYNAAYGDGAMYTNTVGVGNTAVGSGALYNTSGSSYNTVLGYHAGINNNLGWNNTLIGAECNVNASGIYNSVAVGNGVNITANNQVRFGNFSTTSIGGYQPWSYLSDGRYKRNIKEDVPGLDFILKLRPVTYQVDLFTFSKNLNKDNEQTFNEYMVKGMKENEKVIQTGFIAQEVEQAANEVGFEFNGVDKPKNPNDYYSLRYSSFVVPLVKAVQEQQKEITDLRKQNDDMNKRIQKLETVIAGLGKN